MALIGLDTCLWIYLLEDHPRYARKVARLFDSIRDGTDEGVFSALGMIEILTGSKKLGRFDLAAQYEQHIRRFPNVSIVGLNEKIVWLASDLRATYNLKTPDSVHLATAIDAEADVFLTNDKFLKKVKEIRVQIV